MRESRLRWQCRRGMRELDVLLRDYLDRRYEAAGDTEKRAFEQVLTLPDPELAGYLLGRQRPESATLADIIDKILERDPP